MDTKATHTQHRAHRRYAPGTSRKPRSAVTLLAQVADIERGQRIRARREELHLTQPAVVDLLEEAAKRLPETHELHPLKAGKAPVTLRGYQSYEGGGGIVWEKAKLLAQVLQMDVQAMMSGEPDKTETPDLSRPAQTTESALAHVLAAITAQLGEQTQVLTEVKSVLVDVKEVLQEVKGMLGKDTETADRMEAVSQSLGGAAARLDEAVQRTVKAPRSAPARKAPKAPKTAPRRTRPAST